MKKILALVLALMLVLASLSALATSADGKTITLTGGKKNHTYTLYQIFTGTVNASGELENIQWGSGVTDTFKATKETAAAYAKEVATQNDARKTAQTLIANEALTAGTENKLTADGDVVFAGLAEGYYVIVDTNGNTQPVEGDYSSALIVKVVGDVTGALKADKPTSEKKVLDTNDSATEEVNAAEEYQDSADYDIGDPVPFQLKATTANNVAAYKKYHITFQDKQSDGLDAPTSWTVTVLGKTFNVTTTENPASQTTTNGTEITVEKVTADANQTFAIKVTFEPTGDDVYLNAECNTTSIYVNYNAVLNEHAEIGSAGNPNTSYIKYSNNPESTDDKDEGKTPEDKVIVFTYQPVIDKVDEIGAPLKGADFTLYKKVTADYEGAKKMGSELTFGDGVEHSAIKENDYYVEVGHKTGTTDGTQFSFKGIDDGTYVLVETTVPTGYNAFKSVTVTVSAEHDEQSEDPKLTKLEATDPFTAEKTEEGVITGKLNAEIENNSGATLPETGGIGTTIFYIAGSILVLAAVVLLVTKRRMNAEK